MRRIHPPFPSSMPGVVLASTLASALALGTGRASAQGSAPASAVASAAVPAPCAADADARRFDFWLGTWDVRTPDGRPMGRNVITRVAGGCGLQEAWTAGNGSTGTSLNAFNPVTRQWQQFWVGQFGAVTEYRRSEWRDDGSLVLLADTRTKKGEPALTRLTFTPLADGRVRQHFEQSTDGGRTYVTTVDLYYQRIADAASP